MQNTCDTLTHNHAQMRHTQRGSEKSGAKHVGQNPNTLSAQAHYAKLNARGGWEEERRREDSVFSSRKRARARRERARARARARERERERERESERAREREREREKAKARARARTREKQRERECGYK